MLLLCQAHHHAHHDGQFTITRESDGAFGFHRRGRRLDVTDRTGLTAAATADRTATMTATDRSTDH